MASPLPNPVEMLFVIGGPCLLRGEGDQCREVEKLEPVQMPVPTLMDFEAACTRIARLEEALIDLRDMVRDAGFQSKGVLSGITAPTTQAASRAATPGPLNNGKEAAPHRTLKDDQMRDPAEKEHEDVAMMLEGFAMGHRLNQSRGKLRDAASDEVLTSLDFDDFRLSNQHVTGGSGSPSIEPTAASHAAPLQIPSSLSGIIDPGLDYITRFFAQAPDPVRSWELVRFYFEHLEWYTRVLHAPSFIEECKSLLCLPPHAMSGHVASGDVRKDFLPTYFMVLCLALQFMDSSMLKHLNMSSSEAKVLCKNMFSAAQGLLWIYDFFGRHTLEHLQCVVLMGMYQYNVGMADSHWALLGSAIKTAQNIGLSRLGNEKQQRRWPESWKDPLKREIGRRVWWHLVFLDWSHATAYNACYAIHPSQNFTDFPSNIDDEDLSGDHPWASRPLDEHTDTSFTIYRLKFVALYRELFDHQLSHNPPSYSYIMDMDKRVVRMLENLPPYFHETEPQANKLNEARIMECLLIQLIGETRLLRLHRPYLSRGYRHKKFVASKDRCVQSARSIMHLLKSAEKVCPLLLGQWLVLFYGFGAGIVTFIDLCHAKATSDEVGVQRGRQDLRDIVTILQRGKNVSDAARNATTLLEGLLRAEEEVAGANPDGSRIPRKRKANEGVDGDAFRQVVEKLLLDASSGDHANPAPAGQWGPSPTLSGSHASQSSQTPQAPTSSSNGFTFQPLPFQPDLDIFLDGAKSYTHMARSLPLDTVPDDPTSADLSHLFFDDILSNLYGDSSNSNDLLLGTGW